MSLEHRRSLIKGIISTQGQVGLSDLAERFSVSQMTIRRDLEALEAQGLLRRIVAGAIATEQKTQEPAFAARAFAAIRGKEHIASALAEYIRPHEAVFFDGGSTALAVARALKGRRLGLTVLTRSLFVALEFMDDPDTQIYLLGGRMKQAEVLTISTSPTDELENYNVDTFVMGIGGVHPVKGLTDYDPDEVAGKRTAMQRADRVLVGFDESKFGRVLLVKVADIDQVSVLVTDAKPTNPLLQSLPPSVKVHFVQSDNSSVHTADQVAEG
jgi:DeoR/GlpR family transcriptional regulator of sugar metabolism